MARNNQRRFCFFLISTGFFWGCATGMVADADPSSNTNNTTTTTTTTTDDAGTASTTSVEGFQSVAGAALVSPISPSITLCCKFAEDVDTTTCTTETLSLTCNSSAISGSIDTTVDTDGVANNECCFDPTNNLPSNSSCTFTCGTTEEDYTTNLSNPLPSPQWTVTKTGFSTNCSSLTFGDPPLETIVFSSVSSETDTTARATMGGTGQINLVKSSDTYSFDNPILNEGGEANTTINGCTFTTTEHHEASFTTTTCSVTSHTITRVAVNNDPDCISTVVGNPASPVLCAGGNYVQTFTTTCTVP